MGVPYNGSPMAQHPQYLTVRNSRGREMIDVLGSELIRTPPVDTGDRRPLVMQVNMGWAGGGGVVTPVGACNCVPPSLNSRGREMIDVLGSELIQTAHVDTRDRRPLVMQVCRAGAGGGAL